MTGTHAGGDFSRLAPERDSTFLGLTGALALLLLFPIPGAGQIRPVELDGFIVTGSPVPRTEGTVASHVTVLDGEELRLRGVTRVLDALAEVPGLVVVQGGSYGSVTSTFFRGAESDHVKVMVDGVEMNQDGGTFDFAGLLVSGIERIEVVRGPASAFYGSDAMAGVIHIITRRGNGPRAISVAAGGGSFGRVDWGVDVRGGIGTAGYSLSFSRAESDGILDFNNGFRNSAFSGKAFANPGENNRIEVSGRYSARTYHFPTDGSGNVVDRNAFTFGEEMSFMVEAGRMITDRLEFVAALKTYRWDGGSDDRSDGPADTLGYYGLVSDDRFHRNSGDFRVNAAPGGGSVVSVGVELEQERQDSKSESFSQWGPSAGEDSFERWNRGYYAHLVTEAFDWAGNLGLRLEENEQYGRFFTYQVGLSRSIESTATRLRGSLGRGLKAPTFLETSSSGFSLGNPELEPERSWVWEVGLEQSLGNPGFGASLTWFRQSFNDLIQYTFTPPDPGDPNYFNVAEARVQGLEAEVTTPLGDLSLSGSYTYLDSEVLDAGFDEGKGAVFVEGGPLIRRPEHQGSLRAVYRFGHGAFTGDIRWTGSRVDRDFSAWPATPVELPPYTLVGLGAEVTLLRSEGGRPGVDLRVRGDNLLDDNYQEIFGFRAPGRAFLVGAQVYFGASRG